MSRERLVPRQCCERIELTGQRHFVVLPMNAAMAQPANKDAFLQISFFKVPLEMRPAVHFFGDEVVEGEWHPATTAGAGLRHASAQLCALGSAASMAARISSLSGFTPLEKCSTTSPAGETRYLLKFQRG
jgi:hypothetical protein